MKRPTARKKVRERLQKADGLILKMEGVVLEGDALRTFMQAVVDICGVTGDRLKNMKDCLYSALRHLEHRKASSPVLRRNLHRIFANSSYLEEGYPIPIWEGEIIATDIFVRGVKPAAVPGIPGRVFNVRFDILTDIPAGLTLDTVLTAASINNSLRRRLGAGKEGCPPEFISGMLCRAEYLEDKAHIKIRKLDATESMKEANRELLKARYSLDKCQYRNVYCHQCPKTVNECSLAVWLGEEKE